MQGPNVQVHAVNMDTVRHRANMTANTFYRFPKDKTTFFYLMPPWSERGDFVREVWECFGLPQKHFWTGWRTYEILSPGISEQDPVANFLKANQDGPKGEKIADMLPGPRYYGNALIVGTKDGSGKWEPFDKPTEVQIVQLPVGVYNKICEVLAQPGNDTLLNPQGAAMLAVRKTGSGKTGTKYETQFCGSVAAGPGGGTIQRDNLLEKFGEDVISNILQNLPDLEAKWPMPDDAVQAKAQQIIRDLKAFISQGTSAPAGAQAGPGGSTMIGAPTAAPPGGFGVQTGAQPPAAGSVAPPSVNATPPAAQPPQAVGAPVGAPTGAPAPATPPSAPVAPAATSVPEAGGTLTPAAPPAAAPPTAAPPASQAPSPAPPAAPLPPAAGTNPS